MGNDLKPKRIRKIKITIQIKQFIKNYVISKKIFSFKKLLLCIKKEYNVIISKSSIYNILKEQNITRKRVQRKIIIKNKEKHQKNITEFKNMIKTIDKTKIISIDESSVDLHMTSYYGWSEKGNKIVFEKRILKNRHTMISEINNKKVIHNVMIKGSANAIIFLNFIKNIISKIDLSDKVYLLMDNARIHHYKKLKEMINENPKVEIIYNVPYMPEFNPIEHVFSLKVQTDSLCEQSKIKNYIRKKENNTIAELKKNIENAIKIITEKDLNNYFKHSLEF